MKRHLPHVVLLVATIWGVIAFAHDASFVAYVPCLFAVFWALDQ